MLKKCFLGTYASACVGTALLGLACSAAQAQSLSLYLSAPGEQNTTRPGAIVETFDRGRQKPIPATGTWDIGTYEATINPNRIGYHNTEEQGEGPDLLEATPYGGANGNGQYLLILESPEKVTIDFLPTVDVKYIGFWWPAGNIGNQIEIFDTSNNLLGTFTATGVFNLLNSPTGGNTVPALNGQVYPRIAYKGNPNEMEPSSPNEPFAYVNILLEQSSASIGRVVLSGVNYEVDNFAIAPAVAQDPKWALAETVPLLPPLDSIGATDDSLVIVPTSPPSEASGDVSTNDKTVPGATYRIDPGNEPSHGTAQLAPNGQYRYTPNAGYKGRDSFTYTLCKPAPADTECVQAKVNIEIVPEAVDDSFSGTKDQALTGNVADNDIYNQGAIFRQQSAPPPADGLITSFDANTGAFIFTPAPNWSGVTSFTYDVCIPGPNGGGLGGSLLCDPATVTISIADAAAPTASNVTIQGNPAVGSPLIGSYTYADINADVEATSTFRWLVGPTSNVGDAANAGSTNRSYNPTAADEGRYVFFCVTPVAATGPLLTGAEVCSTAAQVAAAPPAPAAPTATNVAIPSTPVIGSPLTGSYTYADINQDVEATSTFRWIVSTDTNMANGTPTPSTSINYTPTVADTGKYLFFCVTPVALTGTLLTGDEACSAATLVPRASTGPVIPGPNTNGIQAVPTMSAWGLMALSPLLLGAAGYVRRRKRGS